MAETPQPDVMWKVKRTKLWKSIFRHDFQDTPRTRLQRIFGNVFLHLHPVRIPRDALRITYTWGLGGVTFLMFLILLVTGVLLMFYYRPAVEHAFHDMKDLEFAVTLGLFLRNLHRWSAHAMVILAILHMTRVFLTGAYKPPREFNWVIGVILLVLTLFLSYTGYLLPWDQLAFWAVTVGAQMAANTPILGNEGPFAIVTPFNDAKFVLIGGTTIGQGALLRFYVLHCVMIPVVFFVVVFVHFWRVRKDGFSNQRGEKVDVWPHLVSRELVGALAVTAVLFLTSWLYNAPLEEEANPTLTPNPSKAPWYFVGLQELLVYFDPWIAGVVLPTVIIIGLMAIPYIDVNPKGVGRYALKERPVANTVFLFGLFLWFLLIYIGYYCRGPSWEWYWPGQPWSMHRITQMTLLNLPNLWGLLLLALFFAQGGIVPPKVKERLAAMTGPKLTPLILMGQDFGLAALMGAALLIPLLFDQTLFTKLGTSNNAPVLQAAYQASQHLGPAAVWMKLGIIGAASVAFGLAGVWFGRLKERLFKELGWLKYAIVIGLLLMMIGVPAKILLRLTCGVKYIVAFPQFNFNI